LISTAHSKFSILPILVSPPLENPLKNISLHLSEAIGQGLVPIKWIRILVYCWLAPSPTWATPLGPGSLEDCFWDMEVGVHPVYNSICQPSYPLTEPLPHWQTSTASMSMHLPGT